MTETMEEIFAESSKKPKTLSDLYHEMLARGFEDKGNVTKHAVRRSVHVLYKKGLIRRISKGVYVET